VHGFHGVVAVGERRRGRGRLREAVGAVEFFNPGILARGVDDIVHESLEALLELVLGALVETSQGGAPLEHLFILNLYVSHRDKVVESIYEILEFGVALEGLRDLPPQEGHRLEGRQTARGVGLWLIRHHQSRPH